jgi:hypothetical protein
VRPGFLIGVIAFGLLMTAIVIAFGIAKGATTGQLLTFGFLIFAVFAISPLVVMVTYAPRKTPLLVHREDRRGRIRRAVAVFLFLVVAAVVTVLVVHLQQ